MMFFYYFNCQTRELSNFISESVEGGVKYIFKILSNIVDEE